MPMLLLPPLLLLLLLLDVGRLLLLSLQRKREGVVGVDLSAVLRLQLTIPLRFPRIRASFALHSIMMLPLLRCSTNFMRYGLQPHAPFCSAS